MLPNGDLTGRQRLLGLAEYGIEIGRSADLVVLDYDSRPVAVTEVIDRIMGFKAGRRTFSHPSAVLEPPGRRSTAAIL